MNSLDDILDDMDFTELDRIIAEMDLSEIDQIIAELNFTNLEIESFDFADTTKSEQENTKR